MSEATETAKTTTDTVDPSVRCARELHKLGIAITQPEDGLATLIAGVTGCDAAVAAVNSYVEQCGTRAVKCAAGDLLGEALAACRAARRALHVDMLALGKDVDDHRNPTGNTKAALLCLAIVLDKANDHAAEPSAERVTT